MNAIEIQRLLERHGSDLVFIFEEYGKLRAVAEAARNYELAIKAQRHPAFPEVREELFKALKAWRGEK